MLCVCKGTETNTLLHGEIVDLQVMIATIANSMVNAWVERGMDESKAIQLVNQGVDAMRIKRGVDKMMAHLKEGTVNEDRDRKA